MTSERFLSVSIPLLVGLVLLGAWELAVSLTGTAEFILPTPSRIWIALIDNFESLIQSAWVTLRITILAFVFATLGGVLLAVLFSQSRFVALALFPYAIILQVTPVVAIAPLILIWVGFDNVNTALLILAWIVAFFPVLSNTVLGLRSVDRNLMDLFTLYGASRTQRLFSLQLPAALPYILGGMKISGGLALIGAVVAEFVAGSGTGTGLAWRIIEAGNRLQVPTMFAALFLLSLLGVLIFFALTLLEHLVLRSWHESARKRH